MHLRIIQNSTPEADNVECKMSPVFTLLFDIDDAINLAENKYTHKHKHCILLNYAQAINNNWVGKGH